jgi:hypothetical protein
MTTVTDPSTIERHWGADVLVCQVDASRIARSDIAQLLLVDDGQQHRVIPVEDVVGDLPALYEAFRTAAAELLRRDGALGSVSLSLQAEVWRGGYEVAQASSPGDFVGWCFLAATPAQHKDSGNVAILDPRVGAAMVAVPGLPAARQVSVRPAPGNLAVVPGWLTTVVQPVEADQSVIVVVATAVAA